jgi:hypothetical protein
MNQSVDWAEKLRHAIERITKRYEHIGRKTGAPFLAIVYPPDSEREVMKEWKTLTDSLCSDYEFREVDVMALTVAEVEKHGVENIATLLENPMPGSNAESELGQMWVTAVANAVKKESQRSSKGRRLVVVLRGLAALYPATGPRAVMQALWDSQQSVLDGPVVVLVPGSLAESRVYSFLNLREEFMYRGDVV